MAASSCARARRPNISGNTSITKKTRTVPLVSIDSLGLKRLDFIKIDVEGMEEEVLDGAKKSIEKYRPIVMIEVIKSDRTNIENYFVSRGYKVFQMGMNDLAIHQDDPTLASVSIENGVLWLR
ncbi:FkbM family methyltransferase [Rhodocyclus gracilis]|uniref:FkbM family methyltransferase n=1 Tax=Rhodocyclus gracilis TaxID=2929842 RepID=UPI00241422B8|nr:FkbM family methyltransferase [Rhodocyclus gracilis]